MSDKKSTKKSFRTEAKFTVIGKESGININATDIDPIRWDTHKEQAKKIQKEVVSQVPGAFVLKNVLSPSECRQFVEVSEKMGYVGALLTTSRGMVKDDMRNNKRVIYQTPPEFLRDTVWKRIEELCPEEVVLNHGRSKWKRCGLNERIRFYRYTGGESFQPHYDGCYPRNDQERSFMTIIIYLNDDKERKGGETNFFIRRGGMLKISVKPQEGMALLFFHSHPLSPLHEGSEVSAGSKYVLRSDVMYKRVIEE
uniref:Fe2OG dioxygenase domain-containing protein n=1 Tax=Lotharella oceanica TaxID=641309 RepID=A0A7S2TVF5_9EUKA